MYSLSSAYSHGAHMFMEMVASILLSYRCILVYFSKGYYIFIFVDRHPFEWTDHFHTIFHKSQVFKTIKRKTKAKNNIRTKPSIFPSFPLSSIQLLTSLSSMISCFLFLSPTSMSRGHPQVILHTNPKYVSPFVTIDFTEVFVLLSHPWEQIHCRVFSR